MGGEKKFSPPLDRLFDMIEEGDPKTGRKGTPVSPTIRNVFGAFLGALVGDPVSSGHYIARLVKDQMKGELKKLRRKRK